LTMVWVVGRNYF